MHRKSLDELELLSPKELGRMLCFEIRSPWFDLEYFTDLINAGAELGTKDRIGKTPLHWAARNGDSELIQLLLDFGAPLEAVDDSGYTPLHVAVINVKNTSLRLLLDAGANIYAGDNRGCTPMDYAVRRMFSDKAVESAKILLAAGVNKYALNNEGKTYWDEASDPMKEALPELNPNYNG